MEWLKQHSVKISYRLQFTPLSLYNKLWFLKNKYNWFLSKNILSSLARTIYGLCSLDNFLKGTSNIEVKEVVSI